METLYYKLESEQYYKTLLCNNHKTRITGAHLYRMDNDLWVRRTPGSHSILMWLVGHSPKVDRKSILSGTQGSMSSLPSINE